VNAAMEGEGTGGGAWVSVGSRQHGQVSSLSSLRSGWGAVGPVHEWKLIP